jgi:cytoskeletal protein CcmA (bactofilin family)
VIGEQGTVTGNVRCKQADIAGTLSGNIQAQEQLALRGNARVSGNIQTPVLQMEQGVVFNGQCHMGVVEKLSVSAKSETVSLAKNATN